MDAVAAIDVKSVLDEQAVKLSSFWSTGTCLLFFIRRFGCPICRHQAKKLGVLAPQLKEKNIRMIAIGSERFGYEDFTKGNYWPEAGDVYFDPEKNVYNGLGMSRSGFFGLMGSMMQPKTWSSISAAKKAGITGDMKGDGYQLGGCFVIDQEGKTLYEFRQNSPGDEEDVAAISKSLDVEYKPLTEEEPAPECSDACDISSKPQP